MTMAISQDARAVLLPVVDPLIAAPWVQPFLAGGGRGVVLGMTRGEYVSRVMSDERRARETRAVMVSFIDSLREGADGPLLIAADGEPGGIERLHDLIPALPAPAALLESSDQQIIDAARTVASGARSLGVTMMLGPICDELTGTNVWLHGRVLDGTVDDIARVAACIVEGFQEGRVIATAKHFPGFGQLDADPAIALTSLLSTDTDLDRSLVPFRRVVDAGARCIMVGPAPVETWDREHAPCESEAAIGLLRRDLRFTGVVLSDDLEAVSTLRGRPAADVAVSCLAAGTELLLVGDGAEAEHLAEAIESAVDSGRLDHLTLARAAARVRDMAALVA